MRIYFIKIAECVHGVHYISAILNRNTASESIKQKLVFAGSEEGKLLALRQSFAEVCYN